MAVLELTEQTTRLYTTTLRDETGALFNGTAFTSLTLSYYDLSTDTIINNRAAQNVLNQNGVTVSSAGVLQWILTEADTIIVTPANPVELHRALFTGLWTLGAGVGTWRHEISFLIRNLHKVP